MGLFQRRELGMFWYPKRTRTEQTHRSLSEPNRTGASFSGCYSNRRLLDEAKGGFALFPEHALRELNEKQALEEVCCIVVHLAALLVFVVLSPERNASLIINRSAGE
jgi:hypothetical protein